MTAIARVSAAASPESLPAPSLPSGLGGELLSGQLGAVDLSTGGLAELVAAGRVGWGTLMGSAGEAAAGHGSHPLTGDLAVVLVVAAATALIVRRLRLPTVLGYLAAGLMVGPYLPVPLFADTARMQQLAELGIILVMFSVGLEFSVRRLLQRLPTSGLTAFIQIGVMAMAGFTVAEAFGLAATPALFVGAAMAISSTMVVVKVFATSKVERETRELVFGVLVVQDVVAISMLALLAGIAQGVDPSLAGVARLAFRLFGTLAFMLLAGLLVVPRLVRYLDKMGNPELAVVAMSGLAFGLAAVAEWLGYSAALGAFMGGMLVAESGQGARAESLIAPLRDLFAAIFFVSIGMSVDPREAWEHLPAAIAVAGTVVTGQFIAVSLAGVLAGHGIRRSMVAGAALGQVGEFAFIMVGMGVGAAILPASWTAIMVTAAVMTTFTTPVALRIAPKVASTVLRRLPRRALAVVSLYEGWLGRVREAPAADPASRRRAWRRIFALVLDAALLATLIVVGSRRHAEWSGWLAQRGLGQRVAVGLVTAALVFAAVPLLFFLVRNARRMGALVAARILPEAERGGLDLGAAPRRMLTVGAQLGVVATTLIAVAVVVQPFTHAVVALGPALAVTGLVALFFWRSANDVSGHVRAAAQVLFERLALESETSEAGHGGPASERSSTRASIDAETLRQLLPGLDAVELVELPARLEGRELRSLDLEAKTGACVLALARGGRTINTPGPRERLELGDVLALAGSADAVRDAKEQLAGDDAHAHFA